MPETYARNVSNFIQLDWAHSNYMDAERIVANRTNVEKNFLERGRYRQSFTYHDFYRTGRCCRQSIALKMNVRSVLALHESRNTSCGAKNCTLAFIQIPRYTKAHKSRHRSQLSS